MGILDEGLASLADDLAEHNSEPVVYTIGATGGTIIVEKAIRGRSTHERFAIADGRVSFEEVPQDWLIRPADLAIGGVPHEPTRGDRIEDASGNVYQVEPRSEEPGVRRSDPFQHLWRIRTVLRQEGP